MKDKTIAFEDLLAQAASASWLDLAPSQEEEEGYDPSYEEEELGLVDDLDCEILMHRDAHFAGNFPSMIEYYQGEGKGVQLDLPIERILELAQYEESAGVNLAPQLLAAFQMEKVMLARQAYRQLKALYEQTSTDPVPAMVADLILSEGNPPEQEMQALVALGTRVYPSLVTLLQSQAFLDPLFPGYGAAPGLAAECLGRLGNTRAIVPLFEALGKGDFAMEDQVLDALYQLGDEARSFLVKVLQNRPITQDNERAALALSRWADQEDTRALLRQEMNSPECQKHPLLMGYLEAAGA